MSDEVYRHERAFIYAAAYEQMLSIRGEDDGRLLNESLRHIRT